MICSPATYTLVVNAICNSDCCTDRSIAACCSSEVAKSPAMLQFMQDKPDLAQKLMLTLYRANSHNKRKADMMS